MDAAREAARARKLAAAAEREWDAGKGPPVMGGRQPPPPSAPLESDGRYVPPARRAAPLERAPFQHDEGDRRAPSPERSPPPEPEPETDPFVKLGHVVEATGLPAGVPVHQLSALISSALQLSVDQLTFIPVDDRSILLALSSTAEANEALRRGKRTGSQGGIVVRPLREASPAARSYAQQHELPAAHRRQTTTSGANRLIAGSLGIRRSAQMEEKMAAERARQAEARRQQAEEQSAADDLWFDD